MTTPEAPPPGSSADRSSAEGAELDEWLAALRGEEASVDTPSAGAGRRLRQVVLDEVRQSIEQVPHEELAAGWEGLSNRLRPSQPARTSGLGAWLREFFDPQAWLRPPALATAFAGAAFGAVLMLQLMPTASELGSSPDGPQLVFSTGEGVARGGPTAGQTVEIFVADPIESSSVLAEDLMALRVGLQLYRIEGTGEQQVVFTVPADAEPSLAALAERLGIDPSKAGPVVVRFLKNR